MTHTHDNENNMQNAQNAQNAPGTQLEEAQDDTYEVLAQLAPKTQRFIHLYLTGQYSLNKLAQLLELHPNTLQKWMRRKDVQHAIAEMQKTTHNMVQTQLRALTLQAINRLGELTNSPVDGVALQAVKDVLDRAGHKPKNEIKVDKTVTTVEEKLNKLIDDTIDIEYEVLGEDNDTERDE